MTPTNLFTSLNRAPCKIENDIYNSNGDVHGALKSIFTLDAKIHKGYIYILVIGHTQYKL